jgi:nitrile hydratase
MNGGHDLGGMQGFGPVEIEQDEPAFHHDWERRAFAITLAAGYVGGWNIDQSRHAREQQPPAEYLATSYYEHWLYGLERLLDERGLVTRAEREARESDEAAAVAAAPIAGVRAMDAAGAVQLVRRRRASRSDADVAPRFRVGEPVLTKNVNPVGHTRLPRYARGRHGVVTADHGVWIFPDTMAVGLGPKPQHCYTVTFEARELWGHDAPARDRVSLDLWDDHLEPAEPGGSVVPA